MNKISKPVIFFGSGPVAAKSLALLGEAFNIEAVITKPTTTAMMRAAAPQAPLFVVNNKAEVDALIREQAFASSTAILIDFGIIISQTTIDSFLKGIINSHFSLLPEWRGADPITFSILSGQETTGVSLMLLTAGMDEGPLLAQVPVVIESSDTSLLLTEKLIKASDQALKHIVPLWLEGQTLAVAQEQASLSASKTPTYSRKLTKEDGNLDWHKSAKQLEREIRAYASWPKSYTSLAGKDVTVLSAHVIEGSDHPIGTLLASKKELLIQCGQDMLALDSLKPAGKPAMTIQAFLAGYGNLFETN